jgi:DNA-binding MarR family transcriptional regulator
MSNLILAADESAVLSALGDGEDTRLFELSSRTKIVPSEVSAVVERLMKYNLVARSDDTVKLTKQGAVALGKIRQTGSRFSERTGFGELPAGSSPDQLMSAEEIERSLDEELRKLKQ